MAAAAAACVCSILHLLSKHVADDSTPRQTMADCTDVTDVGRLRKTMTDYDNQWQTAADCDTQWHTTAHGGTLRRAVTTCGKLW